MRDSDRIRRREARRAELLDAAVTAIRRDGAAVSMQTIAAEAGVTKPILYKHFGDREGLGQALAGRFAADLEGTLLGALHQPSSPRDVLASTIDAYLAFVERDPELYRFLVRQSLAATGGAGATMTGLIARISQQVALVLGERLRGVGADSGPAEPWAFGLVGLVHLAGDWWIERRTMSRATLVTYLTDFVWSGMAHLGALSDSRRTPQSAQVRAIKEGTP